MPMQREDLKLARLRLEMVLAELEATQTELKIARVHGHGDTICNRNADEIDQKIGDIMCKLNTLLHCDLNGLIALAV
jgi:hypothetical protein